MFRSVISGMYVCAKCKHFRSKRFIEFDVICSRTLEACSKEPLLVAISRMSLFSDCC